MMFTETQSINSAGNSRKFLHVFFAISLMICPLLSHGQYGTEMYDAISAGSYSACGGSTFYDSRNNEYYNGIYYSDYYNESIAGDNQLYGQESPEVWYAIDVTDNTSINISLCGSSFDTYVHVLDEYGYSIFRNDDDYDHCGSTQSYLSLNGLAEGRYYVVVEGYSDNRGDYNLSITSQASGTIPAGANISTAINAGTFSSSGSYSHSLSNANPCLGNDYGRPSIDIFYKFTLNAEAKVKLSHCGSGFDTYIWLLNSSGGQITFNDEETGAISPCPGSQAYLERTLAAGTYYVVSEGYYNTPGILVTNIAVTLTDPVTITYPSTSQTFAAGVAITPVIPTIGNVVVFDRQVTSTYAGTGSQGSADGPAASAQFNWPLAVVMDGTGNLFVADATNQRIRKISSTGIVSTLAGAGYGGFSNGTGTSASFRNPAALTIDASGNLFLADQQNHAIRKITPAGVVTTIAGNGTSGFADGTGSAARFNGPAGICMDASGNLYVSDCYNNRIRKITPTGVVSTYAGTGAIGATNGAAASASFYDPRGLVFDTAGNLIVCDRQNHLIRKITPSGVVSTLAGSGVVGWEDGPAATAKFGGGHSVAIDYAGNLYVVDQTNNHTIRKITPDGMVSTFAGTPTIPGFRDGMGASVLFNTAYGICSGPNGDLYVADTYNNRIRKIFTRPLNITPALPPGLVFDYTNGTISGTAAAISSATEYTISGYGVSTTFTITVESGGTPITPSEDQNYILTYTPRVPITTEEALKTASSFRDRIQASIQYFDGLGRPVQMVQIKGSEDGSKDVVVPIQYDPYGREAMRYLPYAATSNNGTYKADALSKVINYYQGKPAGQYSGFSTPYAQTIFEPSPLNRAQQQGAPGTAWQPGNRSNTSGRTVLIEYKSNSAEGELYAVKRYSAVSTSANNHIRTLQDDGWYGVNQLYLTITKDENWISGRAGTQEEYKNAEGRIIMKRTFNNNNGVLETLSTYYVYDDFGNLNYVLSPKAEGDSGNITQDKLDKLCYQYYYDERNRLIEKRTPGKDWEYQVYNTLNQVVASQDALLRADNQWAFTKYDAIGRVIITGIATISNGRPALQGLIDAQSVLWESRDDTNTSDSGTGYTNSTNPFHASVVHYLTINYYNNYTFYQNDTAPAESSYSSKITGLLTASRNYLTDGSASYLSVFYYDDYGKVIENVSENHIGGTDRVINSYNDITGKLLSSNRTHQSSYDQVSITNEYGYDHMGRRKYVKQNINDNSQIIIASYEYTPTGQLLTKNLGNTADYAEDTFSKSNFMQSVDFWYNERGWLKRSKAGLFDILLKYEDGTSAQFNGNISGQNWGIADNRTKNYSYTYDALDRLTLGSSDQGYSESIGSYDKNGNIEYLSRTGRESGTRHYNYDGNRLSSISDYKPSSYTYYENGNQKSDSQRQISNINYNYLNLPQSITGPTANISYTYDASGRKLKKVSSETGTTDYVNGIHYKEINGAYQIEFVQTEEGRAMKNIEEEGNNDPPVYKYQFTLLDHLGNNRVTFYRHPTTQMVELLESTDYYPFGLATTEDTRENKYLYNGKEIQEEFDELDYGFRFYDPVIARWNIVDPKADKMPSWSSYSAFFNNPIRFVDPDGQEPTPAEAARMAAHVYGDKKDDILTGGWRASQRDFGIELRNDAGLKSLVYERIVKGQVTEYVYATAGTEDWTDWKQNGGQPLGLSEQYHSAASNAKDLSSALGKMELNFVGHSLGGGEAALNSLITHGEGVGRKAFTFNAAGVGDITKLIEGNWKTPFKFERNIDAYILRSDPLNKLQNNSPIMPNVNGNRHYLWPKDLSSTYNGHSINSIIKNFGVNKPENYNQ